MLDNFGQQDFGWNGNALVVVVVMVVDAIVEGLLNHLFHILSQGTESGIDVGGTGDTAFAFQRFSRSTSASASSATSAARRRNVLTQMQGRQIASQGEKVALTNISKTIVTDAYRLVEFGPGQGQGDAMIGTRVTKDVATETTMMTSFAQTKDDGLTMGTDGTQGIGDFFHGEFERW